MRIEKLSPVQFAQPLNLGQRAPIFVANAQLQLLKVKKNEE